VVTLNRRFVRSFRRTTPSAPVLALINAGLVAFADVLLSPYLVALIVAGLGGDRWQVALPLVIVGASWALSVPLRNALARLTPPGRYLATTTGILRTVSAFLISWILYIADDVDPARQVETLLYCYGAYAVASAINLPTTRGLIAASTPTMRAGTIFTNQRLIGAGAAVAAAVVILAALRGEPTGVLDVAGVLIVLAAIAVAAATWFQFMTTLSAVRALHPSTTPRGHTWSGLGNPALRRLLFYRLVVGLSTIADPFLILYATTELGFELWYIGLALVLYTSAQALGSIFGPAWARRAGPRTLVVLASFSRMFAIVITLTLPSIVETSTYTDRLDDNHPAALAFAIGFGMLGFASYLQGLGSQRYLTDVVPAAERTAATSLVNVVLGAVAFAPLLGAWLIGEYDTQRLLVVTVVVCFVALLVSGLLFDTAPRVVRPAGSWRQARAARRAT
jgi:hypothetical protein